MRAKPDATGNGRRNRGRPSGNQSTVNLSTILRVSHRFSKTVPLQALSIVMIARSLGVTPGLIYYYVGSRDELTSATMNLFYGDLLEKLPTNTGDWKHDIPRMARRIYDHLVEYAGIASYVISHNEFRVFQITSTGQRDHGAEVLEKLAACVMQAGCSAERGGIYTHLILEFVIGSAHRTVRHLFPSEHKDFLLQKVLTLDPLEFPTLSLTHCAPVTLGPERAFNEEIRLFMLGLEEERRNAK